MFVVVLYYLLLQIDTHSNEVALHLIHGLVILEDFGRRCIDAALM